MQLYHMRNIQSVCLCLSTGQLLPYSLIRWLLGAGQDIWLECVLGLLALLFLNLALYCKG